MSASARHLNSLGEDIRVRQYLRAEIIHSAVNPAEARTYFREHLQPADRYLTDSGEPSLWEPALAQKAVIVDGEKLRLIVTKDDVAAAALLIASGAETTSDATRAASPAAYVLAHAHTALVSLNKPAGPSGLDAIKFAPNGAVAPAYLNVEEFSRASAKSKNPEALIEALKRAAAETREILVQCDAQGPQVANALGLAAENKTTFMGVQKYLSGEVIHSRLPPKDAQEFFRNHLAPSRQYIEQAEPGIEPLLAQKKSIVDGDKLRIVVTDQEVEDAWMIRNHKIDLLGDPVRKPTPTAYLLANAADALVSPKGSAGRNGELSTIAFDQKRNVRIAYFDVNKLSDIGAKTAASGVSGAASAMLKAIRIAVANTRELDVSHAIMIKNHTRATKRKPTSGKDDLGI